MKQRGAQRSHASGKRAVSFSSKSKPSIQVMPMPVSGG